MPTSPKTEPSSAEITGPSRRNVWRMFDLIAPRYDLLNRLLSMRRDVAWRKALIRKLPELSNLHVLDLATGTADVLVAMGNHPDRVSRGMGIDLSGGMLALGQRKLSDRGLKERFPLVRGDAVSLGVADDTFDAVTVAFGIRNVLDVPAALREMHRVLRPGGRALILEFSMPNNAAFRRGYLLYFRHILPRIGAIISGKGYAYRYLNQTVEHFPYGQAFCRLMENAGFTQIQAHPLSFGIATIYQGEK